MEYPSSDRSHQYRLYQQPQQFIAELDASNSIESAPHPAPIHDGVIYELPAEPSKTQPQSSTQQKQETQETRFVPAQANPWPFYLEDASPRVYQGQQSCAPPTETSSDQTPASPWPYHGPDPVASGHQQGDSASLNEAQPITKGNEEQKQYTPLSVQENPVQEGGISPSHTGQSAPSGSTSTHTAHYIPYRPPTPPTTQGPISHPQSSVAHNSTTPTSPLAQSPFVSTPGASFQAWPPGQRLSPSANSSDTNLAAAMSVQSLQAQHDDTAPSNNVAAPQSSPSSAKASSGDRESKPSSPGHLQYPSPASPNSTQSSHLQGSAYNPASPSSAVPNTPPPAYSEMQPPLRHGTATFPASNGPASAVSGPTLAPPPLPPRPSSAQNVPSFGFSAPLPHSGPSYPPPPKKNSYPGIPPPPPPRPYNTYQRPPSNRLFGSTSAKKWLDKTNQVLEDTIDAVLQGPAGPPHRPAYVHRPHDRPPQPPRPPQNYQYRPS